MVVKCGLASLEFIQLGAAKKILGCSSKTCNEAVRGDMGLESLRDRCKLKWWYKVTNFSSGLPRRPVIWMKSLMSCIMEYTNEFLGGFILFCNV